MSSTDGGGGYTPPTPPPSAPPPPPINYQNPHAPGYPPNTWPAPPPSSTLPPYQPPQINYQPSPANHLGDLTGATAPGGVFSQLNATFPGGYGQQPGGQFGGTAPRYGGGAAAPAVDPNWNPPPNRGDWWLPDGDGKGGHWVHGGSDTPAPAVAPAGAGLLGAPSFAPTFYAPSTNSPYLTLPQNWLGYVDPTTRTQLQQQLEGMRFNPTGDIGQYGEQMYLRPSTFNVNDLNQVTDPAIRQWIRFFLGNLGYGISYQLPSTPTSPGIPPAPPNPNPTAA